MFADIFKVRILRRDLGLSKWTLDPVTSVLIRDTQRRYMKRKKGHVKTEAEIGVKWPQAKGCPGPPEAGRGKERSFPRPFGGSAA